MSKALADLQAEEQRLKNIKLRLECLAIANGLNVPNLGPEVQVHIKELKEPKNEEAR